VTIIACRWNWWLPRRPALLLRVEPSGSCLRPTPFRSQPGDLKAGPGCRPETRAWITARPRRLVPSLRRFSPAGLLLSCRDAHLAAPRASPPKRGKRERRPHRAATNELPATAEERFPRIGGLSCSTSGDLHSKFAGLSVARNVYGSRRPAFANSRVFGADVYDDERAKVAARLAAGDKRVSCDFGRKTRNL
jgi:hypothetical protein